MIVNGLRLAPVLSDIRGEKMCQRTIYAYIFASENGSINVALLKASLTHALALLAVDGYVN